MRAAVERQPHSHRGGFGRGQQHPVAAKVVEAGAESQLVDQPGEALPVDENAGQQMVALETGDVTNGSCSIDRPERERR